jgi:acetyl-CoA acyltransferase
MNATAIVGTGMTAFGKHMDRSLASLAGEAITLALADADVEPAEVQMAFVANAMASITTGQVSVVGQTILRDLGYEDIPVFNIDNACAGSSSAIQLATHAIAAGAADTVLVVGVEKLYAEDRSKAYRALNGAVNVEFVEASGIDAGRQSVFVAAIYPERLRAYKTEFGLEAKTLAQIAVKNRRHAATNPIAQYRDPISVEDVLASRLIVDPLTALMCAPIGDGAAAVVMVRGDAIRADRRPVWIRGSAVGMGRSPNGESSIHRVASKAYARAGLTPQDVDLAEVHDSVAFNELMAYEELGLAERGEGHKLIEEEATSLGGRIPVNVSGGLESRGHPVAATGVAQLVELTLQLRGEAGTRQVRDARVGIAENAGGFAKDDTAAVAVTIVSNELAD